MITGPETFARACFSESSVGTRARRNGDAEPLEPDEMEPPGPMEHSHQAGGDLEVPDFEERRALPLTLEPNPQPLAGNRQRRERRGVDVLQLDVGIELVLECLHQFLPQDGAA